MNYNIDDIYSTSNTLKVTISQTGSRAMVREQGQTKATPKQGYRVIVNGDTVGYGDYNQSERDLLLEVIKKERYAHLAYKQAYNDLLGKLASIGLVVANGDDDLDDRL